MAGVPCGDKIRQLKSCTGYFIENSELAILVLTLYSGVHHSSTTLQCYFTVDYAITLYYAQFLSLRARLHVWVQVHWLIHLRCWRDKGLSKKFPLKYHVFICPTMHPCYCHLCWDLQFCICPPVPIATCCWARCVIYRPQIMLELPSQMSISGV